MRVSEFLNARSISTLQTLQWTWAPSTRRSSSKQELIRILRARMLSVERVRERFDGLSWAQQDLLRTLLRSDRYGADAAFLLACLPNHMGRDDRLHALDDLVRAGFVATSEPKGWHEIDTCHVTVPHELGNALAEALNLDTREAGVMLSLDRYLAELGPEGRCLIDHGDRGFETLLAEAVRPDAIEERIKTLEDPQLRDAVRLALDTAGGILPLERFPSLGLDIESVDSPAWRHALEQALLGTFGHLCLRELGASDDHECLVLYQEVVAAHALAQAHADVLTDHTYGCGIDFLTDLTCTVDYVRSTPSKLTSAGRFFKGARNQLDPLTALHTTFFLDEESLLTLKLTVARELDLVELREDRRLYATPHSAAWQARSLRDQMRAVLDVLLRLGETASTSHFPGLARAATTLLGELPPGRWMPTESFLALLFARRLLHGLHEGVAPPPPPDTLASPWRLPSRSDTLAGIADAVREPLLQALNCTGLIDIGRWGQSTFLRVTPLTPTVLGTRQEPCGKLLLVNPDAEVILFPEPGHLGLLHRLCAFCERRKSEVTLHLRITRDSVQRAVLRGLDANIILDTLRAHSRVPLSQNIDYSVRTWADAVHPAAIRTVHILELPSEAVVDAVLQLPELELAVAQRLSPTTLVLHTPTLDDNAKEALKLLGIHLL